MATCSSASQNAALKARQGSEYKDGCTNSWEITQVKDNITNPENEIVSLLIPEENCPRPEEGGVSWENTHNSRRARLGTCKLQEESSKASSYQDVPVDVGPGFFSSQTSPPLNLSLPITAMTETPLTSDLRVHQMIHKKEKPFTYSRCGKSFTHKANLWAHERIHTGEKPYKCTLCHRSFCQSSTYYHHQKIHEKLPSQNIPSTPESSSLATGTT
ncbi:Zinc finger and SCAN domain-containing protein 4 [Heterocephalus glaber]|uniref:Zinc finger and SCAN domain-containing protein 4 n=1 Tax=Heterocephalus glaber TaxID=10181 RepID=G5BQ45_HETGA|nr:Zinc finger and SCAN domain-containing protein 4 [Heterocephalus glaber]